MVRYIKMRSIKLTALLLIGLFMMACNSEEPQQQATAIDPYVTNSELPPEEIEGEEYWAKDNFDLQRAGDLLQRSESPEQFERYINEPDGINNLDLNGDGYADYISVQEYEDRDTNSRGLSLFSRFGPDLIQEIATILLYRDEPRYPGARFVINGNDQLYGDNYYYETNWLDRAVPIASYLFGNRDQYYQSPYYYDNYPSWYSPYDIVDTPIYRTRIGDLYPQPAFVYTNGAPDYFNRIKIKSPNNGLHLGQIHARLVKPMPNQAAFLKGNPGHSKFNKARKNHTLSYFNKPGRDNPPRSDRGDERGNPARDERGAQRGNPNQPGGGNPNKVDHGGGNPNKGGGNPNMGGGNPNKGGGGPPKADNPNKGGGGGNPNKAGGGNPNKGGGGGNPNKAGGGGNPNKGGGGNPNKGGGGGKGGGKKP
jgi:hypothetical protein